MQPSERLNILEINSSFLANNYTLPTQEELSAVREEIFDVINNINYELIHLKNTILSLEKILTTINKRKNTNV